MVCIEVGNMKQKFQWWQVDAPLDQLHDDDYRWCNEIMGSPNPSGRWWYEQASEKFYFTNQKDAMLFELMWAGHET